MTRIVCVGITVLDRIWYLDDLPKEGGKYVAKDYTEVGGGPAATAAVAAAKLGAEVDFIGRVGDDEFRVRCCLRGRCRRPSAALCQGLNRLRVHVKDVKLVTLFQQILRHWRAHLS